jgi:hypothetical protein
VLENEQCTQVRVDDVIGELVRLTRWRDSDDEGRSMKVFLSTWTANVRDWRIVT